MGASSIGGGARRSGCHQDSRSGDTSTREPAGSRPTGRVLSGGRLVRCLSVVTVSRQSRGGGGAERARMGRSTWMVVACVCGSLDSGVLVIRELYQSAGAARGWI
jgi:hypothetical protein